MHKIGFIVYPGFSTISFAVASVFEMTNWKAGSPVYDLTIVSEHGGSVPTSLGKRSSNVVIQTPEVRHHYRRRRAQSPSIYGPA